MEKGEPLARSQNQNPKKSPEKPLPPKNGGHRVGRRLCRGLVLKILYTQKLNPFPPELMVKPLEVIKKYPRGEDEKGRLDIPFMVQIIKGTQDHKKEIEHYLDQVLINWDISRLSVIDKIILEISIYEMIQNKTDRPIIINEGIELAKKYGAEESAGFVNGILDAISKNVKNANRSEV